MKYDHGKKAGNLGDVWKHAVLVSVARRVAASASFSYLESHAGAPMHHLSDKGEWRRGIGAILGRGRDELHPYLGLARQDIAEGAYGSGWSFFVRVLSERAPEVVADLCDTSETVAQTYATPRTWAPPRNASVHFRKTDGFEFAQHATPNLVFLDPPYHPNADADWQALAVTCQALELRGTPFLAWYPFYWPTKPRRLVDTTGQQAWEVVWTPCGNRPSQNLKGCGLLVSRALVPILESAREELAPVANLVGARDIFVRHPA